jgi:cell wall-associated protease
VLLANVVGSEGVAKPESVAEGIRWLATSGARIIAIPLGDSLESTCITTALDLCNDLDCLVLAAAGNCYPDAVLFPARSINAVAVAGADTTGTLLPTSCRRPGIDLIAPGRDLPGIVNCHIARRSGSSIATIVAAGVAALLISTVGPVRRERLLDTLLGLAFA